MPMGHVALPAFVGQCGLEADPARARPLLGLVHHEASAPEHPVHGRERRHAVVGLAQVVADGPCPRIETGVSEVLAPPDDLVFDLRRREGRGKSRTPPLGLEGLLAAVSKQLDMALHPGLRRPGRGGDGPHRTTLDQHSVDGVMGQIHGGHPLSSVSQNLETCRPTNPGTSHRLAQQGPDRTRGPRTTKPGLKPLGRKPGTNRAGRRRFERHHQTIAQIPARSSDSAMVSSERVRRRRGRRRG